MAGLSMDIKLETRLCEVWLNATILTFWMVVMIPWA